MKKPLLIDQSLLDAVSLEASQSPRRRKNRNFHDDEAALAHRLLNAIEPGSYLIPHRHVDPNKDETMVALRGRLGVVFFDDAGQVQQTLVLTPAGGTCGVNIPYGVYHTVLALDRGTVLLETKAGPYRPLGDDERAPWAPAEGEPAADAYAQALSERFAVD
ncbi:MAG: WbuC family cupin fold metalloprotein [Candidatus Accumulibacter sp.]|jgi:cupin fold WbuC family metalloprotein|uniref:WbuC family cupin fold metalloprotein n=1 Tax=Candidatus Accumulibacter affinis TaxID=2954384 RepID=A0A935TCA3_9PROT|nr:WbuC family cupin fold metalloprotein [Candidatus Accumulibacter affinis]MBP9804313.1 WbuC family cupin fold metalloprotein [Accumulibacter sp.]